MNKQGTAFFIFYSTIVLMLTSNPESELRFKVYCTKLVSVFVSLSALQALVNKQTWKGVREVF
jgi:hypothetical protein